MSKHSVRKKCRECKRALAGTPGRPEWCPDCGGEMVAIPYRNTRKARIRR